MAADTKLQEGVRYGDSNLVESALEEGADPNAVGLYGWSAMHEAASNGDLEILELLVQFKGDPNSCDDLEGCTPLHYAAREGHTDCLRALLKAGGRYDVQNTSGASPLDDAVEECRHILDKEKTKDFIQMTLDTARDTISKEIPQGHKARSTTSDEQDGIREVSSRVTPRAWNSTKFKGGKKTSGKDSLSGSLQLSFEYNSKTKTFKIRVWSLQDVLLPPAEFSSLSRLYVKSHLLPDKKGETKRKTDEIRIDDPTKMSNSLVTLRRKGMKDSFKAIFLPSTFKFSKALEYPNIGQDTVESKTVHIAVCVRQRYSTKTIPVANIQLPMKEAVRKLLKERYPLHSCINYSMPDNVHAYNPQDIVVISEGMYSNRTTSNPTLRTSSGQSLQVEEDTARASSDIDLKAVRCHSVESVPSTAIEVESGPQETSLDDLLEVSVENDNPTPFDPSHGVTVVEVHESRSSLAASPLPGFTEDGELTDVSVVSSPRSQDSTSIDMDGLETIDLKGTSTSPLKSSTPSKKGRRKIMHGFANPHVTIVDNDDDAFIVTVDKMDTGKRLLEKKDAVIDIGSGDHGDETRKKGLKGHLFKKKDRHKKDVGNDLGLDNPGYVVDMRTGQKSLLGKHAAANWRIGDLEMVEILSDEEAYPKLGKKKAGDSAASRSRSKAALRKHDAVKETVISVDATGQVSEVGRKKKYDVHGAMKKGDLVSDISKKPPERTSLSKEEKRIGDISNNHGVGKSHGRVQSPVPVIHVECIDEIDRSISPGNKSPRSPRSPRQTRKISPIPQVTESKTSLQQDFPIPITKGQPQETTPAAKVDRSAKTRSAMSERSEARDTAQTNLKYVSETDSSVTSPKHSKARTLNSKGDGSSRDEKRKERTRHKSPGKGQKKNPPDEPQIEMLTLWNDEEWRKKLTTPDFKLKMFQRTSLDPHPSTPLLKKYHGDNPARGQVTNPAYVPETPPQPTDGDTPTGRTDAKAKRKALNENGRLDKSKSDGRQEMNNNPSIMKHNQSWL